jgi:hypothetical protein
MTAQETEPPAATRARRWRDALRNFLRRRRPDRTLDDWVEMTQEMRERYWRDAEWVSVVIKHGRPGVPNTTITVTRRDRDPRCESRPL